MFPCQCESTLFVAMKSIDAMIKAWLPEIMVKHSLQHCPYFGKGNVVINIKTNYICTNVITSLWEVLYSVCHKFVNSIIMQSILPPYLTIFWQTIYNNTPYLVTRNRRKSGWGRMERNWFVFHCLLGRSWFTGTTAYISLLGNAIKIPNISN